MNKLKLLGLSGLILVGCSAGRHMQNDIVIRSLSADYSMMPQTYEILQNKIKTDNSLSAETIPLYDNIITPEFKPEVWEYLLKTADRNNDYKITNHEARCVKEVWLEEF
jgi:hypothetical protein